MTDPSTVVGIDVSKAALDVAFGLDLPVQRFANEPKGHRQLARALAKRGDQRILLEATGGYEHAVLRHLADRNLPALRVNPRQVRDFARATGILAKTDAIDARVLVRFGAAVEPHHRPLPSPQQERLARLQTRRAQLVAMRTAEVNRLQQATDADILATIKAVNKTIDKQIAAIEAESAEVIAEHAKLQRTSSPPYPASGPSPPRCCLEACPSWGPSAGRQRRRWRGWRRSTATAARRGANGTSAADAPT